MYNKIPPFLLIFLLILFGRSYGFEVNIYGNVSDTNGTSISDAIVRIISESGDIVRTANTNESGNYSITFDINESGIDDGNSVPDNIKLYQNSPNPFRPITCIPFELQEPGNVQIAIYNTLGQKIYTVADGYFSKGYSQVFWNGLNREGTQLPSGIYIYRLESQGEIRSGKMLLQEGESSISIGNVNKSTRNLLHKSQAMLIEKIYNLEAEKEGYFPTVDSSFTITSEDISIEKNLILEDCSLDCLSIYASVDGNFTGIWVFDANSLEIIDNLELDSYPFSYEISSDNSTWYYSTMNLSYTNSITAIDAHTKSISSQIDTRNRNFIMDHSKNLIINYYGSDFIDFYDAQTLTLFNMDSLGLGPEGVNKVVSSETDGRIYSFHISQDGTGIMIYNTESFQIEQIIKLSENEIRNKGMSPADLKLSPDGNYLYATVYNWSDPNASGWYGSFHVIDLSTNQIIFEHICGSYSQMGVSPDGRYVYVSDPAGYLYEMMPTNHVLRYDINSREMELFINGPDDIGLVSFRDDYIYFITDQIVIAPDNRTMFITLGGAVKTADGKDIHMAKIDTYTKRILDYYAIPRDYRGYITSQMKRLRLGKYPL